MIAAILLTLAVIAYRVVLGVMGAPHPDWLHNFSPMGAVILCGAVFFPRRFAIALPLGAMLISDLVLNASYHVSFFAWESLAKYVALGLVCALGWGLRAHPRAGRVMLASVACSLIYYVVTNTGAWIGEPRYAKTVAGWVQALTTGLPNHPPTIFFLRNSLASDLVFTALFLACYHFGRPRRELGEVIEHLGAQQQTVGK